MLVTSVCVYGTERPSKLSDRAVAVYRPRGLPVCLSTFGCFNILLRFKQFGCVHVCAFHCFAVFVCLASSTG